MSLLILGGTGFIGPHHVRAALARGHRVAVFNRGNHQAEFPDSVERLVGDRNGDLRSIVNRDWDAVIDLPTLGPSWVQSIGEALKGRVKHYTFISTCAVYDHPESRDIIAEDSPLRTYSGQINPYSVTVPRDQNEYGALKVLCEQEAEKQFPGRTLILRPGHIDGPGDPGHLLTYWPVRMDKGGEVLAAGDPATRVQFIDVRDLAEWAIRLIERARTGIYNAVGPATPLSLGEMVDVMRRTVSPPPPLTWVPSAWLAKRQDADTWDHQLYWTVGPHGFADLMRMSTARALANGLTIRPLLATLADNLAEYRRQSPERQSELPSVWKKKEDGSGFAIPWDTYLAHERETLAAWRGRYSKE